MSKINGGICIHHVFEAQVRQTPDAVAVVFGDQTLTYHELNERSNQLAHYLKGKGINVESLVGLCVERSFDLIIGILGILKAGGAYVPIDPGYPKRRIQYIQEDSQLSIVLTHSKIKNKLTTKKCDLLCLDDRDFKEEIKSYNLKDVTNNNLISSNLAYVIYTSGSTGKPKGVLVEHHNVVRLFRSCEQIFEFGHDDVWTLFHSYAFDFSVWEIWGALFYGGKLIIVPFIISRSPEDFYYLLFREEVTILNQTPSAFYSLIEHCINSKKTLALRYIIFGGEALEPRKLKPWIEFYGDQMPQLINMFGITETTVHTTYRKIVEKDCSSYTSPIGKALPDMSTFVVNEKMQPLSVGEIGELIICGPGVVRGYLNNKELTCERFISSLGSIKNKKRLYRSGDLVKQLDDGELEYIERRDNQVKIRGFRIELGEIEERLESHELIKAAVVTLQNEGEKKYLVCYLLTASTKSKQLIKVIRDYLAEELPDYMLPVAYKVLRNFPINLNGKLDRNALPKVKISTVESFRAPKSSVQKILCKIWQDIINIRNVGIDDNFFAIGGDSILSIKMSSELRKYGIAIKATDIYNYQTISRLSEYIENQSLIIQNENKQFEPFVLVSGEDMNLINKDIIEDAYPLSYLQQGMIFHDIDCNKDNIYHTVASYRIESAFNEQVMKATLDELSQQHEMFRTGIELYKFSVPLQLVYKECEIPLIIEYQTISEIEKQENYFKNWLCKELKNNFNWSEAPLIRVFVHIYQAQTFRISWSMHHCIEDGWSESILFTEFVRRYRARLNGSAIKVIQHKTKYRDFVEAELNAINNPKQKQFWIKNLAGLERTQLVNEVVPFQINGQLNHSFFYLDIDHFQKLELISNITGVSLKSIFLSAHLKVLEILTGKHDVVTGMVVHGRPDKEDSNKVFGCFLNTLIFRFQIVHESWLSLIKNVDSQEKLLFSYRFFPLIEVCSTCNINNPFDILFNYIRFHEYNMMVQKEGTFSKRGDAKTVNPMSIHFEVSDKGVTCFLSWYTNVIDKTLAQAYLTIIERILTNLADNLGNDHYEKDY